MAMEVARRGRWFGFCATAALVVAVSSASGGCGKVADTNGSAEGNADPPSTSGAASGSASEAPAPPVDAAAPVTACGPGSGASGDPCAMAPPSRCLDTRWLATYTAGACEGHTCVFPVEVKDCDQGGIGICMVRDDVAHCENITVK